MPQFIDLNEEDTGDLLQELAEQIEELEQKITSDSEATELPESFLSSPAPVFDLKVPSDVAATFVYNLYVPDEYLVEKNYVDQNGDKEFGVDPRLIKIVWSPWTSGVQSSVFEQQGGSKSLAKSKKDEIIDFLKNNDFDVEVFDNFLRVKIGASNYNNLGIFEEHVEKNKYSFSYNLKHLSEFAVQSRANYLDYVNSEEDVQDTLSEITKKGIRRSKEEEFDWKNYLFESLLNLGENDLVSFDSGFETDSSIGLDPNLNVDFDYIGFYIKKQKIEKDGTILKDYDSFILLGTDISNFKDIFVQYGGTYRYKVASLGRFIFQTTDANGDPILARAFIRSAYKYTKNIECKASPFLGHPIDIRIFYKKNEKELFVHWHPPKDPSRKTVGFVIYIRDSVEKPYRVLKAFDSTPDGYDRNQFADVDLNFPERFILRSPNSPVLSTSFKVPIGKKFYIALSSFGIHNEISPYSEQFLIRIDQVTGLLVNRISRSGANLGFPNRYLNKRVDEFEPIYYRVGNDIMSKGFDKFSIAFSPESRYYGQVKDNSAATYRIFESTVAENFEEIAKTDENKSYYHFVMTDLDLKKSKTVLVGINNLGVELIWQKILGEI